MRCPVPRSFRTRSSLFSLAFTSLALAVAVMAIAVPGCGRSQSAPPGLPATAASAAPPSGAGQQNDQVVDAKIVLARDGVHPGETVKVAVILKIRLGYHINNDMPADQFLVPTTLAFDESQGAEVVEIVYPPGHRGRFAYTQAELIVYEGEAVLGGLVRVNEHLLAGPLVLRGTLSYQACDNASCLPPKDLRFEFAIPVVEAGQACHELHSEIFEKIPFSRKEK
jgi:DsbC/DsbD-like thiol-disulfide interchange protein